MTRDMLNVFYCNSSKCKHIYIRTDERDAADHSICPKCNERMEFVCDFSEWTNCDGKERKTMLKDHIIVSYKSEEKRFVKEKQIKNLELYYEMKTLRKNLIRLRRKNSNLKSEANEYRDSYELWKNRGIIYHDELWDILTYYEPEKYHKVSM